MGFPDLSEIKAQEIVPGYMAKFVHGDKTTTAYWEIEAGYDLPEHNHIHEQISNVIEGEFELTIDGKTKLLKAGDIAVIPSMAVHSGRSITKCKIIDVFSPIREDYRLN